MSLLSRLAVQAARAYGILSSNPNNVSADYLVVAGGGGAGDNLGGAGGAGGLLTSTATLSTLNTYSITVGAGGLGATSSGANGSNGSNSVISGTGLSTITAIGGGGGAGDGPSGGGTGTAQSGGSGGGGASASGNAGGAGTAGQGNNGGSSPAGTYRTAASGGGGAGTAGSGRSSTADNGGNGGNGTASSISGSSVTYAGGGGGGGASAAGTGGTGGGGNGKTGTNVAGDNGTVNLGGGGGGGSPSGGDGGSGGSGIVIISYTSATPKFVGGTITTSGGKQIHTFTSSGTLSPITPITASYLVVAGGGGGQGDRGGGGGAGGLLTSSTTLYSGATYVVTVGAGGNGSSGTGATNGSNSVLSGTGLTTLTSIGGGYSGGGVTGGVGASGGSGGGGSATGSTGQAGGAGTSGQGYAGGTGYSTGSGYFSAAGGGGAGAVGTNGSASSAGAGGVGISSSISGTATYYAGGGGGSADNRAFTAAGAGGTGGGGSGGALNSNGSSGTPNTGGGGGGGSGGVPVYNGGNGGSGIVIISYAGSQVFNGGLVTTSGGNTIHTFTSTGALTPLTNNLNNSLRFRSSASAYLNRTFSTPTNNRIFTWSGWVKRGSISTSSPQNLFRTGAANSTGFRFSDTSIDGNMDGIRFFFENGTTGDLKTTQVFRDPSAWYHLVVAVDTTQATAANRVKLYINGNQITAFSTASYPAQNYIPQLNSAVAHSMGIYLTGVVEPFDGYMTDINFIDGQALEPYFFGNNDANGVWKPIQYKGTYGVNGFYLTFGNTTSTTTLGYDSSPNGNNWTCNNISLTAGTTYDAMTDVPTNTSATVANYAVMNPVGVIRTTSGALATFAGGNLNVSGAANWFYAYSSIAIPIGSGKYYSEFTINTSGGSDFIAVGINPVVGSFGATAHSSSEGGVWYSNNATKWVGSTNSSYGASYTAGDIIGVAVDSDASTITFYKNNTSQGSISFNSNLTSNSFALLGVDMYNSSISANFGQRPFNYSAPSGFLPLNTYNLPTPTILQGSNNFGVLTYTGNGATSATRIDTSAVNFTPDFVWIKSRSSTNYHNLYDVNRIVSGDHKRLYSNDTLAEESSTYSGATNLNGFVNGGFTTGAGGDTNTNSATYVAWNWKANGSPVTNTSGTITSTVSVNTTAGFSIVTYTGNGTSGATIGHGLGVAPKMIIVKNRTNTVSGNGNWPVYHVSTGNTNYTSLNLTNASAAASGFWNNTSPTSTVFTVGNTGTVNDSGFNYVAYCWAAIPGYSAFTSYTGNGSADGPFVYLGFRPKWLLIKQTDVSRNWILVDSSRNTFNIVNLPLLPNDAGAEYTSTTTVFDFVSNGFKIRSNHVEANGSGNTYIVAAFAEHPFKNSNAR